MALKRNRPIPDVVSQLDLALPGKDAPRLWRQAREYTRDSASVPSHSNGYYGARATEAAPICKKGSADLGGRHCE